MADFMTLVDDITMRSNCKYNQCEYQTGGNEPNTNSSTFRLSRNGKQNNIQVEATFLF